MDQQMEYDEHGNPIGYQEDMYGDEQEYGEEGQMVSLV